MSQICFSIKKTIFPAIFKGEIGVARLLGVRFLKWGAYPYPNIQYGKYGHLKGEGNIRNEHSLVAEYMYLIIQSILV